MNLNQTPRSNRVHIGIFGRRNVGKSSLINAISGQKAAIVSPQAGTTTDPVYRSMEIHGVGPIVLIDTAGIDDEGPLGQARIEKSLQVLRKTDLALLVIDPSQGFGEPEKGLLETLEEKSVTAIAVINKSDLMTSEKDLNLPLWGKIDVLKVSALSGEGIPNLIKAISDKINALEMQIEPPIVGDLLEKGDLVVLVMPQDLEAPKGRLILPQVQTIRDILDRRGVCICVKVSELAQTLEKLWSARGLVSSLDPLNSVSPTSREIYESGAPIPKLVITDSQAFKEVASVVPGNIPLTSFSILFARHKGEFQTLVNGTRALSSIKPSDHVLIAEACTHHPVEDDIGRVKIPKWLEKKVGGNLNFTWVRGLSYPENLSAFKVIVHCGGCMLNRKEMMARIRQAKKAQVPITNYGMTIAWAHGILERALEPLLSS